MTEPVHRFSIEPTFGHAPIFENVPDAPLSHEDMLFEKLVGLIRGALAAPDDRSVGKAEGLLMALGGPKTLVEALMTNWRDLADRVKG